MARPSCRALTHLRQDAFDAAFLVHHVLQSARDGVNVREGQGLEKREDAKSKGELGQVKNSHHPLVALTDHHLEGKERRWGRDLSNGVNLRGYVIRKSGGRDYSSRGGVGGRGPCPTCWGVSSEWRSGCVFQGKSRLVSSSLLLCPLP